MERLDALKLDTLKFDAFMVVEFKVVIVELVANRLSVSIVPSTSKSLDTEAFIASKNEAFIVEPLNVSVSILLASPLQSIFPGANNGPSKQILNASNLLAFTTEIFIDPPPKISSSMACTETFNLLSNGLKYKNGVWIGKSISVNVASVTDKLVTDKFVNEKPPVILSALKVPLIFTFPLIVIAELLMVEALIRGLTISVLLIKSSAII